MKLEKDENGQWWVTEVPIYSVDGEWFDSCGPYDTKKEAEECKQILKKAMI